MKKLITLMVLVAAFNLVHATTYYSKNNGNPGTVANWSSTRDGSGGAPGGFVTSGDIFVVQGTGNGGTTPHSMITTGTLTIGAGVTLKIEGGATITASNAITISGTFQIDNGGTYIHNNATTVAIFNGTCVFGATSQFTVTSTNSTFIGTGKSISFGHLTINTTSGDITCSGSLASVQGNLTIQSTGSGSFRLGSTQTYTTNIAGNLSMIAGTLSFNTSSGGAPTVSVGGTMTLSGGTLNVCGASGTSVFGITGDVTLNGGNFNGSSNSGGISTTTIGGNLIVSAGTFGMNSSTASNTILNLTGNVTISGTGVLGNSTGGGGGYTMNINGSFNLQANGTFLATGTANSSRVISVHLGGDFNMTGGTFDCSSVLSSTTPYFRFAGGASSATFTQSGGTFTTFYSSNSNRGFDWSIANGKTVTFNNAFTLPIGRTFKDSGTLATTAAITNNGTFTIGGAAATGTFQLNNGGSVAGTALTYATLGKLSYNGTAAQTAAALELPSVNAPNDVTVNNAAGVIIPASFARTIAGALTLTSGNLTLNSNLVVGSVSGAGVSNFIITTSTGGLGRTFAAGSFVFPISSDASHYLPVTITNTGGVSQTYTVAVVSPTTYPTASKAAANNWIITSSGSSASTIEFGWNTADAGATLQSNITSAVAYQSGDGSSWVGQGGSTVAGTPNVTSISGVTNFGNTFWSVAMVIANVNYYNTTGADVTSTANWFTNSDGATGTNPADFTTDGQVFNITHTGATMSTTWTVSGSSAKVVVDAVTFPVSNTLTGTVDVNSGGTLQVQTTTGPTLGTLASGSTVDYNSTASQTVTAGNYSNLIISGNRGGTGIITLPSGTIGVSGILTVSATNIASYITTGNTLSLTGTSVGGGGSITINSLSIGSNITIDAGTTVAIASTAAANAVSITATKVLTVNGKIVNNSTASVFAASVTAASLTIAASGEYEHAINGGTIPTATWATGSTANVTGTTSTIPAGRGQTFSNFIFDCAGLASNVVLGTSPSFAVSNLMTVKRTGASTLQLASSSTQETVNVGSYLQTGGSVYIINNYGGASGGTTRTLNVAGSFTMNNSVANSLFAISNSTAASTRNFTLNVGGDISIGTGSTLEADLADVPNTNLILNGTASQDFTCNGTLGDELITINKASGVVNLLSNISITNALTMTAGQLALGNNNITLVSTASRTATISATALTTPFTYGTGKFVAQRYVPGGKRAFRFLGHPFSTTLDISALTDNILVTGGTGTGGFTASGTNNPSAFWYDPTTGDESPTNDIGWTAFTTTDGSGVGNGWSQYKGIRVLVRGSIADGLSPVTPSAVTIDAGGQLNVGTQNIPVTKGTNSGYNFIANPFASSINLTTVGGNVTLGTNVVTNHYVWDISMGSKGGWVNTAFGSSYVLPSFTGFVVKTSANDNITITENAKTTAAATGTLFRNENTAPQMVRLWVKGNNITWDKFELYYNDESKLAEDKHDGVKFNNSEVNFFSIANNKNHSIDSRPFVKDDIIPMGFTSAALQTYTIKATDYSLPANVELYLKDKFLGTETKLEEGTEYTFSITSNTASQGNDRFELVQKQAPTLTTLVSMFSIKLSPNPAIEKVQVNFSNEEQLPTTIVVTNILGQTVKTINAGNVLSAQVNVDVRKFAKGDYFITINNGKASRTEKLIVQ
jgi:hypothetical protein